MRLSAKRSPPVGVVVWIFVIMRSSGLNLVEGCRALGAVIAHLTQRRPFEFHCCLHLAARPTTQRPIDHKEKKALHVGAAPLMPCRFAMAIRGRPQFAAFLTNPAQALGPSARVRVNPT